MDTKKYLAISLFAPLSLLCACKEQPVKLAENGNALAPIVVPDNPTRAEEYAAKELKEHLDKITGGTFEIVKFSAANKSKKSVYLGDTPQTRKLAPDFDPKKVPFDTTLVKTADGNLLIGGHARRGTLYAVYSFLEDELGTKWWTAKESFIPNKPTITLGAIDKKYSPPLQFRQTNYIPDSFNWKFAARNKNGQLKPDDKELSKEISQSFAIGYHSFYKIMPPEKYFAKHPEWYSEIGGKRVFKVPERGLAQLCLTNAEMRAELIKNIREKLARMPYARFVHISQNDYYNYCECKKCADFVNAHGGEQSALLVDTANAVGEAIEKDYPDTRVVTFAYQYSRRAPKNIKPRGNVWIELCSIECDFAHPLESDTDYGFTPDIKEWSKLTRNLTIWNYTTCFSNYIIPYPNIYLVGGDIRFFVKNGAIGLFEQGNSFCNAGDFNSMRLWVMSKLMWNPNLDDKKLVDEFLRGYYGDEIAAIYREYLDTIENRARSVKYAQGCDYVDTLTWMDIHTYNKAATLMQKALDTAKDLEEAGKALHSLLRKVWLDRLPIDYVGTMYNVQLHRLAKQAGTTVAYPKDVESSAQNIINRFVNFGTERIVPYMKLDKFKQTWTNFKNYARWQKQYLEANPNVFDSKDLAAKFAEGTYADFQEDRIEQSGNGWGEGWSQMPSQYIADKNASNGWAAKCADAKRFEIQLRDNLAKLKSASGDANSGKFKIYAAVRNAGDKTIGRRACAWLNFNPVGSHDPRDKHPRRIQRVVIDREFAPSDTYEFVELGTFEHPDITGKRKDAVCLKFLLYCGKNSNLLVDRIVFVRQ